jgi:hypothetical protein
VWAPHTSAEAANIETQAIDEMVNVFTDGYKIQPVIENLFRSEHFYEAGAGFENDNFGSLIKSPLDLSISTLRLFNVQLPAMSPNPELFYSFGSELIPMLGSMGMSFYEPYDVAGYEAYHQFPVYHRFWITPNALTERYNLMRWIVESERSGFVNAYEYVRDNFGTEAPDANSLVPALARYLFPVNDDLDFDDNTDSGLTTARMNYFKSVLLGGFDESYWTTIWNGTNIEDKRLALENLLNAMLQSPEYQLG